MSRKLLLLALLLPAIAYSQPGSEIYLFDLSMKNGNYVLSNALNITNHKGYDNQPFFHPVRPEVYYSSAIDTTNVDIKVYNIDTRQTRQFTSTKENEFSPTVTLDRRFISCIVQRKDGAQDLCRFPAARGGEPAIIINDLKVGYHAWASLDKLLLFVLHDSTNALHYYDLTSGEVEMVTRNIGRSLHKIPNEAAVSFVQKNGNERIIKRYDIKTKTVTELCAGLPGREDLCWDGDGTIFMSDGTKLLAFHPGRDTAWKEVIIEGDSSMLKGITRLAINATSEKLAMVVTE